MMQHTFLRRLVYYLIGFGMGMILVLFFFQNRGCSWLPKNKVKETVLKKIILVKNPLWNITSMESFLTNYDIDFSQSSKDSNEKTYLFTVKDGIKTDKPQFYISFWPDSYLAVVHQNKNELKKINSDVYYKIAHVPSEKNSLVNFDEARLLQKKLAASGLDATHYIKTLSTKGYTLYNHTKPNSSQVFIQLIDKKDTTKITYEWREFVLYPLRVN